MRVFVCGHCGETDCRCWPSGPEPIRGLFGRPWMSLASGSFGGGFVLLNDAGGDAPAFADRDALVFRPRPDTTAALATGCGTPRPAALCPSSLAGMVDEGRELAAERRGVLPAQIDLILRAVQAESHRRIRPAPINIVFERDGGLLCHPGLLTAICYLHRTRSPAMPRQAQCRWCRPPHRLHSPSTAPRSARHWMRSLQAQPAAPF